MIQIIENNTLPEVTIYTIEKGDVQNVAPLLTDDAVNMIRQEEAVGLVAVEENEARGAICVRFSLQDEQVMELCSLYVAPAFRRRALGSTLLLEVLERGMAMTDGMLSRVECWFSSSIDGMAEFLESTGFQLQQVENSAMWRFTLKQVAEKEILHKQNTSAPTVIPLSSLSDLQLRRLQQTLENNGVNYLSVEDFDSAQSEISYVLASREDPFVFHACAIWTGKPETELCLSQFFFEPSYPSAPLVVLRASFQTMMERFAPETVLTVPTLTESSAKLVQQITGVEQPQECLQYAVLALDIF